MAFDRKRAEGALVEIVDALNGDPVVGMGFRLVDDVVVTSCRCLQRQRGKVNLPDPDAPAILVLTRLRRPGTGKTAFGIVTFADPYSNLALLRTRTASGLEVPDELNPVISNRELVTGLEVAPPELSPAADAPVAVCAPGMRWVEGMARGPTLSAASPAERFPAAILGAPVFNAEGCVRGVVTAVAEGGLAAQMTLLAEHLPGWALREARATRGGAAAQAP